MNVHGPPVLLLVGVGPDFGSGHAMRMAELRELLAAVGVPTIWKELPFDARPGDLADSLPGADAPPGLVVLDARDLDPGPLADAGFPVLALDNRCPARERFAAASRSPLIEFYDTLPHPGAELSATLRQALIRRDVRQARDMGPQALSKFRHGAVERRIFVYSGDFPVPELDRALAALKGAGYGVHRCGSHRTREDITWSPRLERDDFVRELGRAACVCTYFGMSLLEAWYLGARPALISVPSVVHAELADYLSAAAGLTYLRGGEDAQTWRRKIEALVEFRSLARSAAGSPDEAAYFPSRPGGEGFQLLTDRVLELRRPEPGAPETGSAD